MTTENKSSLVQRILSKINALALTTQFRRRGTSAALAKESRRKESRKYKAIKKRKNKVAENNQKINRIRRHASHAQFRSRI